MALHVYEIIEKEVYHDKETYEQYGTTIEYTTIVIEQDGESLEILNQDKLLKQRKKTIDGSFDLEIKRINDNPITIRLIANTDDREEQSITVDIP